MEIQNMLTLVNILIVFFVVLLSYQIFLAYGGNTVLEGMETGDTEYKPYDSNNPDNAMILAQQNAGNIAYLKERISKYDGLYQEVQDISGNVQTLQKQVNDMVQAQQDYTNQMTGGGKAPEITGT